MHYILFNNISFKLSLLTLAWVIENNLLVTQVHLKVSVSWWCLTDIHKQDLNLTPQGETCETQLFAVSIKLCLYVPNRIECFMTVFNTYETVLNPGSPKKTSFCCGWEGWRTNHYFVHLAWKKNSQHSKKWNRKRLQLHCIQVRFYWLHCAFR